MCDRFGLVIDGPLLARFDEDFNPAPLEELFDGLYGEFADCRLLVIWIILFKGGAMFDVGVLGPPFISNGSSLDDEFVFESINGDERLAFVVNFDGRGEAAETLCVPRCDGGPCEA